VGYPALPTGWELVGPLLSRVPSRNFVRERPLIYVSLATVTSNARTLIAAIKGLSQEDADVVVSTGRSGIRRSDVDPIPANTSVRDFVPMFDVLTQTDVLITHCGSNSVHESLLA